MPLRHRTLQPLARPPGRGFHAVVIGELQRAFRGARFGNNFPLFVHYGVPLWVPETGAKWW
ncbi:hypothetical protein [Streptomyces sp. NBC_01235]|uniref:hypothetical protein n=1 Tax=Streptomyces sp. NBC_01235 TaxID=2903788 RepID=UPI002E115F5F|nr:hypothetical protein OG289_39665 [Streptomyces sp. NBC_01235]